MIPDAPDDVDEWAQAVVEKILRHHRRITMHAINAMLDADQIDILDLLAAAPAIIADAAQAKASMLNMAEYDKLRLAALERMRLDEGEAI